MQHSSKFHQSATKTLRIMKQIRSDKSLNETCVGNQAGHAELIRFQLLKHPYKTRRLKKLEIAVGARARVRRYKPLQRRLIRRNCNNLNPTICRHD